jgi:rare lipoprotein A
VSRASGLLVALLALLLCACGAAPPRSDDAGSPPYATEHGVPAPSGGGYYKNDGPGPNPPDVSRIEDAEPRVEPLNRFANNPYTALGHSFTPMRAIVPFRQRGLASWYGRMFHGQKTSSGEIYDMYGMTAAHPTLPIPSYAKVTNLRNRRSVVVRINDRGPFHADRVIDLSWTAAAKLGYVDAGSTRVEVELIQVDDFPLYARKAAGTSVASSAPAKSAPSLGFVSTAQATESAPDGAPVYVQLGSFSVRENADSLRERVMRELAWLKDFVQVQSADAAYRVQVGPYRNRTDAAAAAARIREAMQINAVVMAR